MRSQLLVRRLVTSISEACVASGASFWIEWDMHRKLANSGSIIQPHSFLLSFSSAALTPAVEGMSFLDHVTVLIS